MIPYSLGNFLDAYITLYTVTTRMVDTPFATFTRGLPCFAQESYIRDLCQFMVLPLALYFSVDSFLVFDMILMVKGRLRVGGASMSSICLYRTGRVLLNSILFVYTEGISFQSGRYLTRNANNLAV